MNMSRISNASSSAVSRRDILAGVAGVLAASALSAPVFAAASKAGATPRAANAHDLGIKAFSETEQTEDLKAIDVPTLAMQGDDDQIEPFKDAVLLQAKLIKKSTLKVYLGYPHGTLTVNADEINPDLLAFIKG
jgi:pimeloyl-ACP methyl ester carboxylesterase